MYCGFSGRSTINLNSFHLKNLKNLKHLISKISKISNITSQKSQTSQTSQHLKSHLNLAAIACCMFLVCGGGGITGHEFIYYVHCASIVITRPENASARQAGQHGPNRAPSRPRQGMLLCLKHNHACGCGRWCSRRRAHARRPLPPLPPPRWRRDRYDFSRCLRFLRFLR